MRFLPVIGLTAVFLVSVSPAVAQSPRPVALELVLALDSSNSVSDHEFALQRRGLAEAFGSDAVIQAVLRQGPGGVAVAVVEWSNAQHQALAVDWRVLRSAADCLALAGALRAMKRRLKGGTAISGVLAYARDLILLNGFDGRRKVIDVSGDGPDRHLVHVQRARDRAVASGITVNGLAIMDDDDNLDVFYRHHVVGGDDAFVMTASDYEDFAAAMREKLLRELQTPQFAEAGAGQRMRSD